MTPKNIADLLVVLSVAASLSRVIMVAAFIFCLFQTVFNRLVSKKDLWSLLKIVLLLTLFAFILFAVSYWAAFTLGGGDIRYRRRRK